MTYELYIGDRTFSSWSLRGWLMFEAFDIPRSTHLVGLYSGTMADELKSLAPARTVPALKTPDGAVLTDSLAMAETLHEHHPDAGLYPADPIARGLCRSMVAEMHSGFGALRDACPMMLAHAWEGFEVSAGVLSDLARIQTLWSLARERHGASGPWLFGDYSLADAFYAPVAARIATYGLPVDAQAARYVNTVLADPRLRQWRAMGLTKSYDPMPYTLDLPKRPWPGKDSPRGTAVDSGPSENATCPYSGDPVTHFMSLDGHVFGFCNAFCRDKTANDPGAWPQFQAIYSPIVNHSE